MNPPNSLKIVRIRLSSSKSAPGLPQSDVSLPEGGLIVVFGPNGSGKSLIAASIAAALSEHVDQETAENLLSSGLEKIELVCEYGGRVGRTTIQLPKGLRREQWDPPLHSDNGKSSDDHDMNVFQQIRGASIILNGDSRLPSASDIDFAIELAREPLEHERRRWKERWEIIIGPDGHGGKLYEARMNLQTADSDLRFSGDLKKKIESRRQEHDALRNRLTDLVLNGAVLKAERDEIERKVALAERSARLELWLREVRLDRENVENLRMQYSAYQERLDSLTAKFRGVPEEFGTIIEKFASLSNEKDTLIRELAEFENRRDRIQEEILDIERQLENLRDPDQRSVEFSLSELRSRIQEDETKLVELLRQRIALLRKREGFKSKLASLPGGSTKYVDRSPANHPARIRDFEGFDKLPSNAEQLLADLWKARHFLEERTGEMESYQRSRTQAEQHETGSFPFVVATVVGIATTAIVGLLSSWDFGFFTGVAAGGVGFVTSRHFSRRRETNLEAILSAQEFSKERWQRALETKNSLETTLGLLADSPSYEKAREKLSAFKSFSAQSGNHDSVTKSTAQPHENGQDEQKDFIAKSMALEQEWKLFEDGGRFAGEIEILESRISRMKGQIEELDQAKSSAQQNISSRRSAYSKKLDELKMSLPAEDSILATRSEIEILDSAIGLLTTNYPLIFLESNPDVLQKEWSQLSSLRSELRQIKNSLSASLSVDELHGRETFLYDEAAEVNAKLLDIDPVYLSGGGPSEFLVKYSAELQKATEDIHANKTEEENIRRQIEGGDIHALESELSSRPPLAQLTQIADDARLNLEQIEREAATTRDLISALDAELEEFDDHAGARLSDDISKALFTSTDGLITTARIEKEEWIVVMNDSTRKLSSLSRGTADLVRLLLRGAILQFASASESSPIIWDDILGSLDDSSLAVARMHLHNLSRDRQVILFTRDPRVAEWGSAIELHPLALNALHR